MLGTRLADRFDHRHLASGNESDKRPGLVDTVVKSLRKYQNQDGVIDARSLSSVRLASTTDYEVQAAAEELNDLLHRLDPDRFA